MTGLEIFLIILAAFIIMGFILSLRYENIIMGKKVLMDFDDETKKKKYIFHQRINLLLYFIIVMAVYFFPPFRKSEYVFVCCFIVILRTGFLNKKYLNRWCLRKR